MASKKDMVTHSGGRGLAAPGQVRIGISGWRYPPWRGAFYPAKLVQKQELAYASKVLSSIEINGTFYSLQRPENFAAWAADTPDDFVFSVKGPQYITHIRRLKEVATPLANFMASGVFRLGRKLGPFLWQLPPNFKFDAPRIEAFLKLLPHDAEEGTALARRHDKFVTGRCALKPSEKGPLRHAMEIRNASFVTPEFIDLLRAYDVALVCADTPQWPRLMDLTSDFVYCRLHGCEQLYASGYDDKALDFWTDHVVAWARGGQVANAEEVVPNAKVQRAARDVFVYFDNDVKVLAPANAQELIARVDKILPRPRPKAAADDFRVLENPGVVTISLVMPRPTRPRTMDYS